MVLSFHPRDGAGRRSLELSPSRWRREAMVLSLALALAQGGEVLSLALTFVREAMEKAGGKGEEISTTP